MSTIRSKKSISKSKVELFVYGFIRKQERAQFHIPEDIFSLILEFYPTKYSVYGIGQQFCGQFGLNHSNTLKNYTLLNKLSSLISHPYDLYNGWFRYTVNNLSSTSTDPFLYSAGNNNYGQCGRPYNAFYDDINTFTSMCNITKKGLKLVSHGAYSNHSFFVYDNKIIAFGCNTNYQLGPNPNKKQYIMTNNILNTLNISKIVCGNCHTIILTSSGTLFSQGNNDNGQCGRNINDYPLIKIATIIPNISEIIDIETGATHNLLINSNHELITFGNNTFGQCLSVDSLIIDKPNIHNYFSDNNIIINKINCGIANSLVIDINYQCYLFGNNTFGNIGNGLHAIKKIDIPFKFQSIDKLKHFKVIDGCYGDWHCILLTKCNKIYSFGRNSFNQCSIKTQNSILYPYCINKNDIGIHKDTKIQRIIAGAGCTLIIVDAD